MPGKAAAKPKKFYGDAESVEQVSRDLIGMFHPELASARIKFIFVSEASMKQGRPVFGKVRKLSGALEFLIEHDFLIEVALDQWNEMSAEQRTALVDHLLEGCTGEENDNTGEMKWSVREPEVKEFATILRRHGVWHDSLQSFVSIAKSINIDALVEEVEGGEEVVTTTLTD